VLAAASLSDPLPSMRAVDAPAPRWLIDPCSEPAALDLAGQLGVSRTMAEVLLRRGHGDAASARAFLEAEGPRHDPLLLGDMSAACDRILAAIEGGERICVHGDYDADGICATALAVLVLRSLGAEVGWHLPSRFEEGYGVGAQALERLAGEGVKLVVTVDCGITATAEVARARELGMDVIVTDHHRPADQLPDCVRVCTRPSNYPFPELCGTGVVLKLAEALFGRSGRDRDQLDQHLDLVALATVADVVPLLDENRGLVRAGLRRMARTAKPGLRALMAAARIDRTRVAAGDLGFRLGPRINAAGRLGHPGVALDLLLTDDDDRARELAAKLESLNRRRQSVEEEILELAAEQVEARDAAWRERRAYVLASPDWHEGVIGIVASRLVERYGRPVVLIAVGDEGAKGSGRSIPAYDLHAGLSACAGELEKFGGHRAAAGLSIDPLRIERFAELLAEHAAAALDGQDLGRAVHVDAVVAPSELSLELADELARLEPCGLGNPGVTLLAPATTLTSVETMSEGKHVRMAVELGGFRCRAVGFGMGRDAPGLRQSGRHDVAFRLQRNQWNGTVTPQMLVRAVRALDAQAPAADPRPSLAAGSGCLVDARGQGTQIATIARLLAGGDDVLVVVAERARRQAMLTGGSARLGSRWPSGTSCPVPRPGSVRWCCWIRRRRSACCRWSASWPSARPSTSSGAEPRSRSHGRWPPSASRCGRPWPRSGGPPATASLRCCRPAPSPPACRCWRSLASTRQHPRPRGSTWKPPPASGRRRNDCASRWRSWAGWRAAG
jgi:single-stranded-DNA-specific exonuclease